MKEIIKKYKKLIIMFSFAYIYMFAIFLVPSGFALTTPGDISSTSNVYDIEGVDFTNNFNTVSVYSWHELTVFQKWAVSKSKSYDLHEQYDADKELSMADVIKQGNISKQSSHEQAIITAYEYASKKDNSIKIDYKFKGLIVYSNFGKFTNIGDLVVGINDVSIDDVSKYEDFLLLAYDETAPGSGQYRLKQNMKITLDNGKSITTNYTDDEFMYFMPKFEILETTPTYNEKQDRRNVGGPSGGAMQSLAIYTALLNIRLDNLKIAGTGTIDLYKYRVGNIGGLVQKYYTVIDNKVDVFFVPKAQYHLIENIIDNDKIKVYSVENFDDMIEKIEELLEDA